MISIRSIRAGAVCSYLNLAKTNSAILLIWSLSNLTIEVLVWVILEGVTEGAEVDGIDGSGVSDFATTEGGDSALKSC